MEEIKRAALLDIPYVVMHPGAHLGEGEGRGIRLVADALAKLYEMAGELPVKILIETTAGQGTNLGYRFEHIAEMIKFKNVGDWLGVCLDTCHVFAAGYDFRTEETYAAMISEFDKEIGLKRLKLLHMNDSKRDLGSRVDRHEHLGQGFIGRKPFSFFLNDPRLNNHPFIIETPKGKNENGVDWDVLNLKVMRGLMGKTKNYDRN